MRDALASLEKVASLDQNITFENAVKVLGDINYKLMFNLTNAIFDRNEDQALSIIENINNKGKNLKLFINEFTSFILDINKYIISKDFNVISIPKIFEQDIMYTTNIDNPKQFYTYILKELIKLKDQVKYDTDVKSALEITLLFLCK